MCHVICKYCMHVKTCGVNDVMASVNKDKKCIVRRLLKLVA